jgi:pimeloyl-ACP methyl ester carboxylesterase
MMSGTLLVLAGVLSGALALPSAAFAQAEAAASASSLTVIDPYLLTIPSDNEIPISAVVASLAARKATAKGIMADGTSAAIAVFDSSSSGKVTFSVTNGAKVVAYSPEFLTTVASGGSKSVTVTPIKVDKSYYALALVTDGAAPDAEHGASTIISAASADGATKATLTLPTLPTPVVLVHGLWGDIVSLASTEGYLKGTPAYTANRWLITPICYSTYLGFDAAADTLPGHGSGCEVTSAQAFGNYLSTTLYKQLDEDHYVGGRVDAVVHSMGGLAARHFASTEKYRSVRNRMLGTFRNVITLDTPETGSSLAAYLDDTAYDRTFQASVFSTEYLLWANFCGSTSTTIETCFDDNGLPLSFPGTSSYPRQPLSSGAVYSLIPGGRSIASSPPADVFNTAHGKWYAIASNYKNGDHPPALLRDVLDTVIAATYSSSQTPPTVDSILGTPDDDVIVSYASQTATAPEAQVREFKDLEHTPAPGEASLLFSGDSNAAVVDSAAVNAQVAYWLGLQSSPAPAARAGESRQWAEMAESTGELPRATASFLVQGRLSASVPAAPVGLGQTLRIPLTFSGAKIVDVAVDQFTPIDHHILTNLLDGERVGSGLTRIVSQEAGRAEIEVILLQTGPVELRISALFADGGLAQQKYRVNVVPSARGLESFDLNRGFHTLALAMEDREEDRQTFLFPEVQYAGLEYPIVLSSSDGLQLTVDQPEDDPVIRVESNGLIHALRPGTAVITGDFDGVRDRVKVDVYAVDDAPAWYRRDGSE